MPIYEYYCAHNHTVYQFYAKSLAQGKLTPKCPDNPRWPLKRIVSQFAFTGRAQEPKADADQAAGGDPAEDARMQAPRARRRGMPVGGRRRRGAGLIDRGGVGHGAGL